MLRPDKPSKSVVPVLHVDRRHGKPSFSSGAPADRLPPKTGDVAESALKARVAKRKAELAAAGF
jgi:hypothetical protein